MIRMPSVKCDTLSSITSIRSRLLLAANLAAIGAVRSFNLKIRNSNLSGVNMSVWIFSI